MKKLLPTLLLALLSLPVVASAYVSYLQPGLFDGGLSMTNGLVHDASVAYPEEALVLGYSVDSTAAASRDLWLLAVTSVKFAGAADRDLRVLAQSLTLDAPVSGNVAAYVNGAQLTTNAAISGDLLLFAANVVILESHVAGETILYAPTVRLVGTYDSDVRIHANHIDIAPGTVIRGKLLWDCPESPSIPPDASIAAIETRARPTPSLLDILISRLRLALTFFIALLLLGLPTLRFFPIHSAAVLTRMKATPLRAILLGFLMLILIPFLSFLLLATGYAAPLALAILLLYALLLLTAPVLLAAFAGHLLLRARPVPLFRTLATGLLLFALLLLFFPTALPILLIFSAAYVLGAFLLTLLHPPQLCPLPKPPPPPIS